eukprot:3404342-Pleurochrysis_carterae.AAC.1
MHVHVCVEAAVSSYSHLATAWSPSYAAPSAVCPERSRKLTDALALISSLTTRTCACFEAEWSAAVPFSVVASTISGVTSGGPFAASKISLTARKLPAAATIINGVTPASDLSFTTSAPFSMSRLISLIDSVWAAIRSGEIPSAPALTSAPCLMRSSASDSAFAKMAWISSGISLATASLGSAPASKRGVTDCNEPVLAAWTRGDWPSLSLSCTLAPAAKARARARVRCATYVDAGLYAHARTDLACSHASWRTHAF